MAGRLQPALPAGGSLMQNAIPSTEQERRVSRSPHPYHRRGTSLLKTEVESDKQRKINGENAESLIATTSSESGTEADDERGRLLKGLPAPPMRPHKGLRHAPFEDPTPQPSPVGTPPAIENDEKQLLPQSKDDKETLRFREEGAETHTIREKYTKRKRSELARRFTETTLFITVGLVVSHGHFSEGRLQRSKSGEADSFGNGLEIDFSIAIICHLGLVFTLYLLFPMRATYKANLAGRSLRSALSRSFHIPSRFDPAPLLYPVFLPLLVSISLSSTNPDVILPNIILGLSSLPSRTVPFSYASPDLNCFHWFLTLLPSTLAYSPPPICPEIMTLVFPLHVYTSGLIEFLTTTSLDVAELRLLATGLIDLYMFARSPQSEILKALVWLGTMLLLITCRKPLTWELALARIPTWRFRQTDGRPHSSKSFLQTLDRRVCYRLVRLLTSYSSRQAHDSDDSDDASPLSDMGLTVPKLSITINGLVKHQTTNLLGQVPASAVDPNPGGWRSDRIDASISDRDVTMRRRHTLPAMESSPIQRNRTTPSGRPKRALTTSSQNFLSLTPAQAAVRRWAYAVFVYAAVLVIILGPIRIYVSLFSLRGYEPFSWALGYLFGDVSLFRFGASATGLDTWIPLPSNSYQTPLGHLGWVEQLRQSVMGPANMRLVLCVYCVFVLLVGMATVLQLSSMVEVDTRRKVFHGMMVAMLLPTVFIDPCFTSLALILILAIFLLLDLFRAAQLPPVSRPLTAFLAPYVDGRDHRGPIIVSHIFLLIGCAIPLWLSLAAVRRTGEEPWIGWDVDSRDVSMLSGVICVGMGDSAASLVGRRYGRHKWYWRGGKSLEGSLAFGAAVTIGLTAAHIWLRVGGWVLHDGDLSVTVVGKAWLAACGASLTEAVLTGANDNVVVPVVLWLLVRGLRL